MSARARRLALCVVTAAILSPSAIAQQPTFRSGTQLVIQTVTVTGTDGKPVEGLMPNDFVVTEDGESQTISLLEFQRVQDIGDTPSAAPASPRPTVTPPTPTQISAPGPNDTRYRDRRLLVLYFDLTAMPPPDQARAFGAALTFINRQMEPQDLLRS
jgi:VWFA-related protein